MTKTKLLSYIMMGVPGAVGLYFVFWVMMYPITNYRTQPVFYLPAFLVTLGFLSALGGYLLYERSQK